MIVLLDSAPLGLVTNPRASATSEACRVWLEELLVNGIVVAVPEIVDYEIRRELIRGEKLAGIARLDQLTAHLAWLPIDTPTMRVAARFWAEARNRGIPTANDKALDCDMILAAQARRIENRSPDVIIATTNTRHLSAFADARHWNTIKAP